ncbi:MAG TPA: hypothetical protein VJQ54_19550, partial [Candidatus Sulfotelmatobacter sp.]|nr:hypothetical protein [Candidatus Sulfotelmatobacter sp.]
MTRERWEQVKDVLDQVLAVAPEERSAFLDRACASDKALRQEVQSLLSASDEVRTSFLQSSPPLTAAIREGARLGDYEVKKLIGAGGMGEVYRAHDSLLKR